MISPARLLVLAFCAINIHCSANQPAVNGFGELSAQRIDEIASMLPEKPSGFGQPIEDRVFWSDPVLLQRIAKQIQRAEKLLVSKFPDWDDAAYLEFSEKGTRPRGEKMVYARASWLSPLVLAECAENKGRFLPLINKVLEAYVAQPTWTLPAHDGKLQNFHREEYDVDLEAARFGHELAQACYLLGAKISPEVRVQLEAALEQRIFKPVRMAISGGNRCYWLGNTRHRVQNNWNAVCLAGVVGAARSTLADKSSRALFIAAAEHYSKYYLNSIPEDGYCEEGTGYWNYGFGHLVILREEVIQSTGGKIDLFSDPAIGALALYGVRFRIGPTAIPPFGDCRLGIKPSANLLAYCNDTLNLGLKTDRFNGLGSDLVEGLMTATPCARAGSSSGSQEDPLRFFFQKVGVLSCRPATGSECKLGIGIKAAGNGTHSHNDVGSYAIVIGDDVSTGDPGGPQSYTKDTFGPRRYDHKILNSFGHPVPAVGGKLQVNADTAQIKATVAATSFTANQDEITIDMTAAYEVAALTKLTRNMVCNRRNAGRVVITDEAVFSEATAFEDALITRADWKQIDTKTFLFKTGPAALLVTIECTEPFHVTSEKIEDLSAPVFTRIGLVFDQPVKRARIAMAFEPAQSQ